MSREEEGWGTLSEVARWERKHGEGPKAQLWKWETTCNSNVTAWAWGKAFFMCVIPAPPVFLPQWSHEQCPRGGHEDKKQLVTARSPHGLGAGPVIRVLYLPHLCSYPSEDVSSVQGAAMRTRNNLYQQGDNVGMEQGLLYVCYTCPICVLTPVKTWAVSKGQSWGWEIICNTKVTTWAWSKSYYTCVIYLPHPFRYPREDVSSVQGVVMRTRNNVQ